MKRTISLLLALILLTTGLTACGDASGEESPANPAEETPGAEEEPVTEVDLFADYREINLGGREIHISVSSNISEGGGGMPTSYPYIAGPEELTGESVQDNVFERNHTVEELLSCSLRYEPLDLDYNLVQNHVEKLVMSGDTSIDCYVNDQYGLLSCAMNHMLLDLNDPSNFGEKDWFDFGCGAYYADYMKGLMIGDKRYVMTGDYFIDTLRAAHVLYLNKNLYGSLYENPDGLYEIVLSGDWTMDRTLEMVASAYLDLDGNGEASDDDQYGLAGHSKGWAAPYYVFYFNYDAHLIDPDENGLPFINEANADRMSVAAEKLMALDDSVGMYKTSGVAESLRKFVNGQSLFTMFQKVGDIEQDSIRDFDGMGLIPYPKLDETQAEYRTLVHDTAEMGAIPATIVGEAASAVSAAIQVMSVHAHEYLLNDYYEVALKSKYAQDPYTAQMLDLVVAGISAPFELAYKTSLGEITFQPIDDCITQKANVIASTLKRLAKPAKKGLEKLVEAYTGTGE